jgi:hypothetical protein
VLKLFSYAMAAVFAGSLVMTLIGAADVWLHL